MVSTITCMVRFFLTGQVSGVIDGNRTIEMFCQDILMVISTGSPQGKLWLRKAHKEAS